MPVLKKKVGWVCAEAETRERLHLGVPHHHCHIHQRCGSLLFCGVRYKLGPASVSSPGTALWSEETPAASEVTSPISSMLML